MNQPRNMQNQPFGPAYGVFCSKIIFRIFPLYLAVLQYYSAILYINSYFDEKATNLVIFDCNLTFFNPSQLYGLKSLFRIFPSYFAFFDYYSSVLYINLYITVEACNFAVLDCFLAFLNHFE